MNPISEYDIIKDMLIKYRRLSPTYELEDPAARVNYDYRAYIKGNYPDCCKILEEVTAESDKRYMIGNLAAYYKKRYHEYDLFSYKHTRKEEKQRVT